ncbi:MAG: ethylbenzene dehydrogenase-related protein [Candidatus Nitricoxidivorans perseverans]|uniref:Ethylbenzene dehydrogenase-related protein n=1 Tax=Candidatus Nitricoxidivorans perseverans TaxID=2975601 RepID=A0AA49J042_9PROT|nr:MAG: ethylbenzene dehydrogenase-related protein [Candidatus Nitricoxidivorans perseverans]
MKKISMAVMAAFVAGGAGSALASPDWSKAPVRKVKVFYPGQSSLEWVMNKADHSAVPDIVEKKRPCAKCHEGDANDVGNAIVAGKPVGSSKSVLEPKPIAGKVGWLPIQFQAAHDGEKIYFRFEWVPPKLGDAKMDKKNEMKLTMLFDGGGTVEGADLNGCWSTCHDDMRTMKSAKDDKKTKHIKDADLAGGKFYDLIQFRSGEKKLFDGHVADKRVEEGGKGLVKAEGVKDGNKWVVTFERKLAGGGAGDHAIAPGKTYNFGFAIHEDHTEARYHYVSLGYQFGLDKAVEGVKNYYNVVKQ